MSSELLNRLDTALFKQANIAFYWHSFPHSDYPQLFGEFFPCLSKDLPLNAAANVRDIIRSSNEKALRRA